jgi:C4-dicarboxylate-specific signal transduction histidine kinase
VVIGVAQAGRAAAQVARRLLDGTPATSIPPLDLRAEAVVDARQLDRFGISASTVPPGTQVRHRPMNTWDGYRLWILAGATVLALQTVLIGGLLSERRRRLRSQEALAQRLRMQALVADISSAFAETSADRVETQMVRSLEHVGLTLGASDCALWAWQQPGTPPRLFCRWVNQPGALPVVTVLDQVLLGWARPRLERGEEVQVSDLAQVVPPPEALPPTPVASVLMLPLRVDGRAVGVLSLTHPHSQAWTAQVIGDLRTVGGIVATAVVRARAAASSRAQLETLAHVDRVAGLGEAAASIAHELSQPLAAILSNAEVAHQLLALPAPPLQEVREILADVMADDERAGGIIRNMRTTLRKRRVEATPVHVNVVAAEIRRLVAHDARMRRTTVELELGQGVPLVCIDETQLKQVLLNLVVNAVDAMSGATLRQPVHLRTSARDDGAVIEVRDFGPGIAPDVLPRLFDPFFTTKADGLGVGLAISRSIVEAVGGRISAGQADGPGAVFRIWLPALRPDASVKEAS